MEENEGEKYEILGDEGIEVEFIDMLGDELTIVNSARVSYGKRKSEMSESDFGLIRYLIRNQHYSPFRHVVLQFRIKCPEFVARQMYKHIVGIDITAKESPTKDHAWNEISGRYVEMKELYLPDLWRKQSKSSKQGSAEEFDSETSGAISSEVKKCYEAVMDLYVKLVAKGVAKEQARMLLPVSFFTEFYWTASFQAVMHFLDLRMAKDAQSEIRHLAERMNRIVREKMPMASKEWEESRRVK